MLYGWLLGLTELGLLIGERYEGESDKAVVACNDFLRFGPGRSLPLLVQKYGDMRRSAVPTQSLDTLQAWSRRFSWSMRAAQFDAEWEAIKDEERRKVMEHGLAQDYERVRKLLRLADFIEGQLFECDTDDNYPNVWLPDVKQIGTGDSAERVDLVRFNAPIIAEFRAVLDDIAKETGGRVKRLGGEKPGEPIPVGIVKMDLDEL